jgi:ssRNA-specific RNase YbeY (16S rRNA maturation enzyme)
MRAQELIHESWYRNLDRNHLHMMGYDAEEAEDDEDHEDRRQQIEKWIDQIARTKH